MASIQVNIVAVGFTLATTLSLTCAVFRKNNSKDLFLGFDFSTQSLTTIITTTDKHAEIVYTEQLVYDTEFPQYGTRNGVIQHHHCDDDSVVEVVAPSLIFVEALERSLSHIPKELVKRIRAISGSAQQHGTVYWNCTDFTLQGQSLLKEVASQLAVMEGPIWMDSSTTKYCKQIEAMMPAGGETVAAITGSRAYERFSANQIAKILKEKNPTLNDKVKRVSLLSSALASLLLGRFAPIDISDGSGMNLMDVKTGKWSRIMAEAYAHISSWESAHEFLKLVGPDPVPSYRVLGSINSYFAEKFGLDRDTQVVAFSGDNPNTIAGVHLEIGDVTVSLGTSTTVMGVMDAVLPSGDEGHVLRSPIHENAYIVMLCFKNGAIPRNEACQRLADGSWVKFEKLLSDGASRLSEQSPITLAFPDVEITPLLQKAGTFTFVGDELKVDLLSLSPEEAISSIVLGQLLALRHHSKTFGMDQPIRLILTGGASTSKAIQQILADIFQAPVYTTEAGPRTAAYGAALRARHAFLCDRRKEFVKFQGLTHSTGSICVSEPDSSKRELFNKLLSRYGKMEQRVMQDLG